LDAAGGLLTIFGRAGVIILACEDVERAFGSIETSNFIANIAFGPIEIEIALEHAGATLLVIPERLLNTFGRTLGSHHTRDNRRADLAAMHIGTVHPRAVVPRLVIIRALDAN